MKDWSALLPLIGGAILVGASVWMDNCAFVGIGGFMIGIALCDIERDVSSGGRD